MQSRKRNSRFASRMNSEGSMFAFPIFVAFGIPIVMHRSGEFRSRKKERKTKKSKMWLAMGISRVGIPGYSPYVSLSILSFEGSQKISISARPLLGDTSNCLTHASRRENDGELFFLSFVRRLLGCLCAVSSGYSKIHWLACHYRWAVHIEPSRTIAL